MQPKVLSQQAPTPWEYGQPVCQLQAPQREASLCRAASVGGGRGLGRVAPGVGRLASLGTRSLVGGRAVCKVPPAHPKGLIYFLAPEKGEEISWG